MIPPQRITPTTWRWIGVGGVLAMALAVRVPLLGYESIDYVAFTAPWWQFIKSNGGLGALEHAFSDYNVPYLALMAVLSPLTSTPLVLLKVVGTLFDLAMAWFTFRIVASITGQRPLAVTAGLAVMLMPTVVLNSAMWGQSDSIYTALGLAGIYFLLQRRPWLGCALIGAAFAFKQQALFLLPIVPVLAVRGQCPWRCLIAIPAAFGLGGLPAILAGRPIGDVLTIYADQAGEYQEINLGAPNPYSFLGLSGPFQDLRTAGILLAGAVTLAVVVALAASTTRLEPRVVLLASATFALLMPYLLPGMHERYFFAADVLTISLGFVYRRLWVVPLLVQFASVTAYAPFLFLTTPVDLRISAAAMGAALVVTLHALVREAGIVSMLLTPPTEADVPHPA